VPVFARTVMSAILVIGMVACASPVVPSPTTPSATVATDPPTALPPSPTVTPRPTPVPSQPNASPAVTVRRYASTAPFLALLLEEIMKRGDAGDCPPGTREGDLEFGVPDEDLRKYLAAAHDVEVMIGPRVWLGTLAGWARSLGSTEVRLPGNPASRYGSIILRVPEGLDIGLPVGTLAAIQLRRLDAPAGVDLPVGAEIWGLSWNVAFVLEHCGKPTPT
jgi:hypothetical protein